MPGGAPESAAAGSLRRGHPPSPHPGYDLATPCRVGLGGLPPFERFVELGLNLTARLFDRDAALLRDLEERSLVQAPSVLGYQRLKLGLFVLSQAPATLLVQELGEAS